MKTINVYIRGDEVYKVSFDDEVSDLKEFYGYVDCVHFFEPMRKKLEDANEEWAYKTYHHRGPYGGQPYTESLYKEQYFKGNKQHRLDGPAYVSHHTNTKYRHYYIDGVSMGIDYDASTEEEIRNHGLLL